MTAQDRADFVSVAEAARRLGISTATVKRRIAAGQLEAEQLRRPQGFEYRARLTGVVPAPSAEHSDSESLPPPTVATRDVAAAISAAVTPLAERLAVQDATTERQAERIAELERENGRLSAELAALSTAHAALTASPSPQDASGAPESTDLTREPATPWWRRWRAWLATALVVAVVGSASCQASASTKHAGLCTSAQATMDYWSTALAGQPLPRGEGWDTIESAVRTVEKVC